MSANFRYQVRLVTQRRGRTVPLVVWLLVIHERPREPHLEILVFVSGLALHDKAAELGGLHKARGYSNAGNALSSSERAAAIALFGSATDTSNVTARARALRQVAEDQDLYNSEFN